MKQECESCKSVLVQDPFPHRGGQTLLCPECDFTPEAIKKEFNTMTKIMESGLKLPQFIAEKLDPIFETKKKMNAYLSDVFDLVDGDESASHIV